MLLQSLSNPTLLICMISKKAVRIPFVWYISYHYYHSAYVYHRNYSSGIIIVILFDIRVRRSITTLLFYYHHTISMLLSCFYQVPTTVVPGTKKTQFWAPPYRSEVMTPSGASVLLTLTRSAAATCSFLPPIAVSL